jgi:hypothetical protein
VIAKTILMKTRIENLCFLVALHGVLSRWSAGLSICWS